MELRKLPIYQKNGPLPCSDHVKLYENSMVTGKFEIEIGDNVHNFIACQQHSMILFKKLISAVRFSHLNFLLYQIFVAPLPHASSSDGTEHPK